MAEQKTLCDRNWESCTLNDVYLDVSKLKNELDRAIQANIDCKKLLLNDPIISEIKAQIDFTDKRLNSKRIELISFARAGIFDNLPLDTKWYRSQGLEASDIFSLYHIHDGEWIKKDKDGNDLKLVELGKEGKLEDLPRDWGAIILFGNNFQGAFTIIEGNHRLAYYYINKHTEPITSTIYLAISPSYYLWHNHWSKPNDN